MVVFALCSHQGLPWAAAGAGGLAITAAAIVWAGFGNERPAELLGLERPSSKTVLFSAVGIALGGGGGMLHRDSLGLSLAPTGGIEAFVAVACLIGGAEEIVYRGWLLGRARALGWPAAVVIAALAHAAYKTALFAWPADPVTVDLAGFALWTTVGGIALGLLRVSSRSVIPPLLAHAAFDFVVYGSVAHAPWWVWG
jgi:membrane protease YdiL (CAAX protease family)